MGRTVAEVALLMTGMADADAADPAGQAARGHIPSDCRAFLKADALKGTRLGVLRQAMGFHPDVDRVLASAIEHMPCLCPGADRQGAKAATVQADARGELGPSL
jgi:Asp-tRNA(Asn)/Glu-tRNA(Gln) amidotransferase A subunit family amidase